MVDVLTWDRDRRREWFEGWRLGARGYHPGDDANPDRMAGHAAGGVAAAKAIEAAGDPSPLWRFGWTEGAFYGHPRTLAAPDAADGSRAGAEVHVVVRERLGL